MIIIAKEIGSEVYQKVNVADKFDEFIKKMREFKVDVQDESQE